MANKADGRQKIWEVEDINVAIALSLLAKML
jgi:hypothetical protein